MVTVTEYFSKERIQLINNTKTTSLAIKELKRREGGFFYRDRKARGEKKEVISAVEW